MSEPQVHHEQDKNWLRRFLAQVTRQKHGDIIAVNVGQGARNVAVGQFVLQNNLQIGTLVVPIRFILVLLLAAAVVAWAAWYLSVPGQMPPNTYTSLWLNLGS